MLQIDTLDKDDLKVALQDVIELAMRRREFVRISRYKKQT
jgi:hypothetical protein